MQDQISRSTTPALAPAATQYVAPRIESVMKPDDLAREVQYAGSFDNTVIFIA
jgi:hypothetical protein